MFDERFVGTNEEVGGDVEVVGDGVVDGVAVAGWFDDLDVSPTIKGLGLRAAWAIGQDPDRLAERCTKCGCRHYSTSLVPKL